MQNIGRHGIQLISAKLCFEFKIALEWTERRLIATKNIRQDKIVLSETITLNEERSNKMMKFIWRKMKFKILKN